MFEIVNNLNYVVATVMSGWDEKPTGYIVLNTANNLISNIDDDTLRRTLISNGNNGFFNIKLDDTGKIVGKNEKLDRYPKVDMRGLYLSGSSLVVLSRTNNGYMVSDYTGEVKELTPLELAKVSAKMDIANAKIVNRDGKIVVAPFKGTFPTYESNKRFIKAQALGMDFRQYVVHEIALALTRGESLETIISVVKGITTSRYGKEELRAYINDGLKKAKIPLIIEEITHANDNAYKNVNGQLKSSKPVVVASFEYTLAEDTDCKILKIPDGIHQIIRARGLYFSPGTSNIRKIIFGKDVKEIETMAFAEFKCLEEVVFNTALERIGEEAFSGCTSLQRLTFPKNFKRVKSRAFLDCSSIKTAYFSYPNTTALDELAFANCTSLEAIKATGSLILYGKTIIGCDNLKTISAKKLSIRRLKECKIPGLVSRYKKFNQD